MPQKIKNFLHKTIALALSLSFLLTGAKPFPAIAAPAGPSSVAGAKFPGEIGQVSVPGESGSIEDSYQGSSGQTVVLIQDAHSVPEAQKNIQNLISHFEENYGISIVALEGASSELDARIFKNFPEKRQLEKVLSAFMEKGELPGGAAAALLGNTPAVYHGAEDWNLYEDGLNLYSQTMAEEPVLSKENHARAEVLEKKKKEIYSQPLFDLDQSLRKFSENAENFSQILEQLALILPPEKGSDLEALIKEIQMPADASFETKVLKISDSFTSFLNKFSEEDLRKFNESLQAFKTSTLSARSFLMYLKETASKYSIPFSLSPELQRQARHEARLREMEGTRVFREFEKYAGDAKEKLFRNNEERKLDRESELLDLQEKAVRLELSREGWEKIKKEGRFETSSAFYQNAEQRDRAFFKNLQRLMRENGRNQAVMVAGGFHTAGLKEQLRENGISYITVIPAINAMPDDSIYRSQMNGEISWKGYLKPENGKLSVSEGFTRALRDQLLKAGSENPILLKTWRDQIIRDLASEEKTGQAGQYLRYLDEVFRSESADGFSLKWKENIENFLLKMKTLDSQNRLNTPEVLNLFKSSNIIPRVSGAAILTRDLFDLKSRSELRASNRLIQAWGELTNDFVGVPRDSRDEVSVISQTAMVKRLVSLAGGQARILAVGDGDLSVSMDLREELDSDQHYPITVIEPSLDKGRIRNIMRPGFNVIVKPAEEVTSLDVKDPQDLIYGLYSFEYTDRLKTLEVLKSLAAPRARFLFGFHVKNSAIDTSRQFQFNDLRQSILFLNLTRRLLDRAVSLDEYESTAQTYLDAMSKSLKPHSAELGAKAMFIVKQNIQRWNPVFTVVSSDVDSILAQMYQEYFDYVSRYAPFEEKEAGEGFLRQAGIALNVPSREIDALVSHLGQVFKDEQEVRAFLTQNGFTVDSVEAVNIRDKPGLLVVEFRRSELRMQGEADQEKLARAVTVLSETSIFKERKDWEPVWTAASEIDSILKKLNPAWKKFSVMGHHDGALWSLQYDPDRLLIVQKGAWAGDELKLELRKKPLDGNDDGGEEIKGSSPEDFAEKLNGLIRRELGLNETQASPFYLTAEEGRVRFHFTLSGGQAEQPLTLPEVSIDPENSKIFSGLFLIYLLLAESNLKSSARKQADVVSARFLNFGGILLLAVSLMLAVGGVLYWYFDSSGGNKNLPKPSVNVQVLDPAVSLTDDFGDEDLQKFDSSVRVLTPPLFDTVPFKHDPSSGFQITTRFGLPPVDIVLSREDGRPLGDMDEFKIALWNEAAAPNPGEDFEQEPPVIITFVYEDAQRPGTFERFSHQVPLFRSPKLIKIDLTRETKRPGPLHSINIHVPPGQREPQGGRILNFRVQKGLTYPKRSELRAEILNSLDPETGGKFSITADDGSVFEFQLSIEDVITFKRYRLRVFQMTEAGPREAGFAHARFYRDRVEMQESFSFLHAPEDGIASAFSEALYVSESVRGQYRGAGRALMITLMMLAQRQGIQNFILQNVSKDAEKFYAGLNFKALINWDEGPVDFRRTIPQAESLPEISIEKVQGARSELRMPFPEFLREEAELLRGTSPLERFSKPRLSEMASAAEQLYNQNVESLIPFFLAADADSEEYELLVTIFAYNGNLLTYARLRELYPKLSGKKQKDLLKILRQIQFQAVIFREGGTDGKADIINRRTWPGRLDRTFAVLDRFMEKSENKDKKLKIADFAVSEGVTTLELARHYQDKGVKITGYDRTLGFYVVQGEFAVYLFSDSGELLQIVTEKSGIVKRGSTAWNALAESGTRIFGKMDSVRKEKLPYVSLLSPEAEEFARLHPDILEFKRQDIFLPLPEQYDFMRVSGLLVRGRVSYFSDETINKALQQMGTALRDGGEIYNINIGTNAFDKPVVDWDLYQRSGDQLILAGTEVSTESEANPASQVIALPARSELRTEDRINAGERDWIPEMKQLFQEEKFEPKKGVYLASGKDNETLSLMVSLFPGLETIYLVDPSYSELARISVGFSIDWLRSGDFEIENYWDFSFYKSWEETLKKGEDLTLTLKHRVTGREVKVVLVPKKYEEAEVQGDFSIVKNAGWGGDLAHETAFWNKILEATAEGGKVLVSQAAIYARAEPQASVAERKRILIPLGRIRKESWVSKERDPWDPVSGYEWAVFRKQASARSESRLVTQEKISAVIEEVAAHSGLTDFDDQTQQRLIEKLKSLKLEAGKTALVLGPGSGDYLPVVLEKLGLKTSVLEPDSEYLSFQVELHRGFGLDQEIPAYQSYSELKGKHYDYIFALAMMNPVYRSVEYSLYSNFAPAAVFPYLIQRMRDIFLTALKSISPSGSYLIVNDLGETLISAYKQAVPFIADRANLRFDLREDMNVDEFSIHTAYLKESRTGVVYFVSPRSEVRALNDSDQAVLVREYPKTEKSKGNEIALLVDGPEFSEEFKDLHVILVRSEMPTPYGYDEDQYFLLVFDRTSRELAAKASLAYRENGRDWEVLAPDLKSVITGKGYMQRAIKLLLRSGAVQRWYSANYRSADARKMYEAIGRSSDYSMSEVPGYGEDILALVTLAPGVRPTGEFSRFFKTPVPGGSSAEKLLHDLKRAKEILSAWDGERSGIFDTVKDEFLAGQFTRALNLLGDLAYYLRNHWEDHSLGVMGRPDEILDLIESSSTAIRVLSRSESRTLEPIDRRYGVRLDTGVYVYNDPAVISVLNTALKERQAGLSVIPAGDKAFQNVGTIFHQAGYENILFPQSSGWVVFINGRTLAGTSEKERQILLLSAAFYASLETLRPDEQDHILQYTNNLFQKFLDASRKNQMTVEAVIPTIQLASAMVVPHLTGLGALKEAEFARKGGEFVNRIVPAWKERYERFLSTWDEKKPFVDLEKENLADALAAKGVTEIQLEGQSQPISLSSETARQTLKQIQDLMREGRMHFEIDVTGTLANITMVRSELRADQSASPAITDFNGFPLGKAQVAVLKKYKVDWFLDVIGNGDNSLRKDPYSFDPNFPWFDGLARPEKPVYETIRSLMWQTVIKKAETEKDLEGVQELTRWQDRPVAILHAGLVQDSVTGKTGIIMAPSDTGKSTLAYYLSNRSGAPAFKILADDDENTYVMLNQQGQPVAVGNLLPETVVTKYKHIGEGPAAEKPLPVLEDDDVHPVEFVIFLDSSRALGDVKTHEGISGAAEESILDDAYVSVKGMKREAFLTSFAKIPVLTLGHQLPAGYSRELSDDETFSKDAKTVGEWVSKFPARSEARMNSSIHMAHFQLTAKQIERKLGISVDELLSGKIVDIGLETDSEGLFAPDILTPMNLVTELRKQGKDIVGLDPNAPAEPAGFYVKGVAQKMPFEDSSVDLVISVGLFDPAYWYQIIDKPVMAYYETALEINRVLKPGGRALIIPYSRIDDEFFRAFRTISFEVAPIDEKVGEYLFTKPARSEVRSDKSISSSSLQITAQDFSEIDDLYGWVEQNTGENDKILVLPFWLFQGAIADKATFRQTMVAQLLPLHWKMPPGGPYKVFIGKKFSEGQTIYSFLISEISLGQEKHPASPSGTTLVLHNTNIRYLPTILQHGLYAMPLRYIFHNGNIKPPSDGVTLYFDLPNNWLVSETGLDYALSAENDQLGASISDEAAAIAPLGFKGLKVAEEAGFLRRIDMSRLNIDATQSDLKERYSRGDINESAFLELSEMLEKLKRNNESPAASERNSALRSEMRARTEEEWRTYLTKLVAKLEKGQAPTPENVAAVSNGELDAAAIRGAMSHHKISRSSVGMVRERIIQRSREEWVVYLRGLAQGLDPKLRRTVANVARASGLTSRQIRKAIRDHNIPYSEIGIEQGGLGRPRNDARSEIRVDYSKLINSVNRQWNSLDGKGYFRIARQIYENLSDNGKRLYFHNYDSRAAIFESVHGTGFESEEDYHSELSDADYAQLVLEGLALLVLDGPLNAREQAEQYKNAGQIVLLDQLNAKQFAALELILTKFGKKFPQNNKLTLSELFSMAFSYFHGDDAVSDYIDFSRRFRYAPGEYAYTLTAFSLLAAAFHVQGSLEFHSWLDNEDVEAFSPDVLWVIAQLSKDQLAEVTKENQGSVRKLLKISLLKVIFSLSPVLAGPGKKRFTGELAKTRRELAGQPYFDELEAAIQANAGKLYEWHQDLSREYAAGLPFLLAFQWDFFSGYYSRNSRETSVQRSLSLMELIQAADQPGIQPALENTPIGAVSDNAPVKFWNGIKKTRTRKVMHDWEKLGNFLNSFTRSEVRAAPEETRILEQFLLNVSFAREIIDQTVPENLREAAMAVYVLEQLATAKRVSAVSEPINFKPDVQTYLIRLLKKEGILKDGYADRTADALPAMRVKQTSAPATLKTQSIRGIAVEYFPEAKASVLVPSVVRVVNEVNQRYLTSDAQIAEYRKQLSNLTASGNFKVSNFPANPAVLRNRFISRDRLEKYVKVRDFLKTKGYQGRVVNPLGGGDIETASYLTDSSYYRIFDALPFEGTLDEKTLRLLREVYQSEKAALGYNSTLVLGAIGFAKAPLLWELEAMGVDMGKVKITKDAAADRYFIDYEWSYDGNSAPTPRRIEYNQREFEAGETAPEGVFNPEDGIYLSKANLDGGIFKNEELPAVVVSFQDAYRVGYRKYSIKDILGIQPQANSGSSYAQIEAGAVLVKDQVSEDDAWGDLRTELSARSEVRIAPKADAVKLVAEALAPGNESRAVAVQIDESVIADLIAQYRKNKEALRLKMLAQADVSRFDAVQAVMNDLDSGLDQISGAVSRKFAVGLVLPDGKIDDHFLAGFLSGLDKGVVGELLKDGRVPEVFRKGLSDLAIQVRDVHVEKTNAIQSEQAEVPAAFLGSKIAINEMFLPLFLNPADLEALQRKNPEAARWIGKVVSRALIHMADLSQDENYRGKPQEIRDELLRRLNLFERDFQSLITLTQSGGRLAFGVNTALAEALFEEKVSRVIGSAA